MYYKRFFSDDFEKLAGLYSVVLVTGSRQSGKTEFCRNYFPKHRWVLLDRLATLDQARKDPHLFLLNHPPPVIFDEVQRSHNLLLEIKAEVDEKDPAKASYILTGSQPFQLMHDVSESLAGRVGILEVFPFLPSEIIQRKTWNLDDLLDRPPIGESFELAHPPHEMLLRGFYPAMALTQHSPTVGDACTRLRDYIKTYLTKDLRDLSLIKDLAAFEKFLRQIALMSAQVLNISAIGNAIGLKQSTASEWLSLLEASYLYWRLPGFHQKLGRRESKRSKGVMVDSGLVASLMGYQNVDQISASPLLGRIFETAALNTIRHGIGRGRNLYHWRSDEKNEVDLVLERSRDEPIPIEIKLTSRPAHADLSGIEAFKKVYPASKIGIVVSMYEKCCWLKQDLLHVPFAML